MLLRAIVAFPDPVYRNDKHRLCDAQSSLKGFLLNTYTGIIHRVVDSPVSIAYILQAAAIQIQRSTRHALLEEPRTRLKRNRVRGQRARGTYRPDVTRVCNLAHSLDDQRHGPRQVYGLLTSRLPPINPRVRICCRISRPRFEAPPATICLCDPGTPDFGIYRQICIDRFRDGRTK